MRGNTQDSGQVACKTAKVGTLCLWLVVVVADTPSSWEVATKKKMMKKKLSGRTFGWDSWNTKVVVGDAHLTMGMAG